MYTYPKNYKPHTLGEQFQVLHKAFPEVKKLIFGQEVAKREATDDIFLIPHWKLIGQTYNEAVERVMAAIAASRPTYDYRKNWGPKYLRQLPIKEAFWNGRKEDVLLLSAQFGQKHAGKSIQAVRSGLQANELPLGLYEVGIMLLTHPERLQNYNDLCVDCPGDEYSPDGHGSFSMAPFVYFFGKAGFGASVVSNAYDVFGSVSGFLPQPLAARTLESSESLDLEARVARLEQVVKNLGDALK